MGFSKWKESRKNVLHVHVFAYIWIFTPAVIGFDVPLPLEGSGSPAGEVISAKGIDRSGMGGPDTTIETFFDKEDDLNNHFARQGFKVSSSDKTPILRENYLNYASAILPVSDPTISSDFGWRTPPCGGCSADHRGVDFVPGVGEPVVAVLDGMVVESGYLGGFGYWVQLEHLVPNSNSDEVEIWETTYAHLQEGSIPDGVKIGSVVKQGEKLGKVGNTGMSTGPHLHFEIRINEVHVDPLPYVSSFQVFEVEEDEYGNKVNIKYR